MLTLIAIVACQDSPPAPTPTPAPVSAPAPALAPVASGAALPVPDGLLVALPPVADLSRGLEPYPVPVPDWMTPPPIPADNPLTHAGVALGRLLFYDPLLSGKDTQSCASCHEQARAFTDGRAVSIGEEGRALGRNAMALMNLAWTAPYFWDGRAPTLEALVPQPITHPDEMNESLDNLVAQLGAHPEYPARFEAAFPGEGISEATISKAIAQFLRTLVSFNSRADLLNAGVATLTELEMRGNQLMIEGLPKDAPDRVQDICDSCHTHSAGALGGGSHMGLFTSSKAKSNGLPDLDDDPGVYTLSQEEADWGRFVVPSIRNLSVTAPYMHDGRFATLDDVIDHYNDHIVSGPALEAPLADDSGQARRMLLDEDDKAAVVAMIRIFTDESFLTNPAFSDPFAAPSP